MGLIQPIYTTIQPVNNNNFTEQWCSCLTQLTNSIENKNRSAVRINIFVKSENHTEYSVQYREIHQNLKKIFGDKCPPFSVITQEPAPYKVACEIGFIENDSAKVSYSSFQNCHYCAIETDEYKEYWILGTQEIDTDQSTQMMSTSSFAQLNAIYNHLGLQLNNIVRQWNYVGQILSEQKEDQKTRQNYQILNEVRNDYYKNYRTRTDFPAATGIGMKHPGIIIESIAMSGNDELKIIPISSPVQTESYHYGQKVLVGNPDQKRKQNQAPQFERALLVTKDNTSRLIISGTASIINQETIGIDDIEEQTRTTIQNIQRLSAPDNLLKHAPQLTAIPNRFSYVRVYIKNINDVNKVKLICGELLGNVPTTYVIADVCRENLLVEIETELVS